MSYDIRMAKLVTGELILGKYNAQTKAFDEAAIVQTIPSQQSVQMLILPYGYPFEEKFEATIAAEHILYNYKAVPSELETKYLEACTNLTLNPGSLGKLDFGVKN